jgi:hypothetical protein
MLIVAPMSLLLLLQLGCPPSGPASRPGTGSDTLDRGGVSGSWSGSSGGDGRIYVLMTFNLTQENRLSQLGEYAVFEYAPLMTATEVRNRMKVAWNTNSDNKYTRVLESSGSGFRIVPINTNIKIEKEALSASNPEGAPMLVPPGGILVVKPPPPGSGLTLSRDS